MAKLISVDLTNNKLCILEYTTTDGQMLSLKEDKFDAKIVSHTYTDVGKTIFDKPITTIVKSAFWLCKSLTSVYCKAITPPVLGNKFVFDDNGSGRKIYVPAELVSAYKSTYGWSNYASDIVGYDF